MTRANLRGSSGPAPDAVGLGIVGLGTAGVAMLGAALCHERVRLVAVADERIDTLDVSGLDDCRSYRSAEELLEDRSVDAVHIATPTALHVEHVRLVLEAGRHVIVEKPVARSAAAARELHLMARQYGAVAIVGHSESFEPYVVATSEVIRRGDIGGIATVLSEKFTDWMRRPRLAEELDPLAGGGIVRRQGVHQVDVVRTVAAGYALQVRVASGHSDPNRRLLGGYTAWLGAPGGLSAVLVQDGVGSLIRTANGSTSPTASIADRPKITGDRDFGEILEKRRRSRLLLERAVRERRPAALGGTDRERLIVMGADGCLDASSKGVRVVAGGRETIIDLGAHREGRAAVLDELVDTLSGADPVHDLAWGEENLRLCEEIDRLLVAA